MQPLYSASQISPRSSKYRGYSTHVSSLPPTITLALSSSSLSTPFLKRRDRERERVRERGREREETKDFSRLSPYTLLYLCYILAALSSFSDYGLSSTFAQRFRHENDAHRNDWRPCKKCTRAFRYLSLPLFTAAPCPRVSPGKVFQTLKMHDIPTVLRGEARRIDIHAYIAYIRVRVCAPHRCCTYSDERWEFLYERRADKGNEERDKHYRCRYFIKYLTVWQTFGNFDSTRCSM